MEPGARPPFDEFPIFRYLPRSWFSWYKKAADSLEITHDTWNECRRRIDERRSRGDKRDCMADDLIDQFDASEWPISQLSFNLLLGEMVEGGADTSAASLRTLILALVAYPECQKKAQEQIDAVCGTQRSPNWSDFDRLPYVNMLVKEGLRWRPVYVLSDPSLPSVLVSRLTSECRAPTALPHQLRQGWSNVLKPGPLGRC